MAQNELKTTTNSGTSDPGPFFYEGVPCQADVQYQLCKVEVNQCTKVLYHELLNHVDGNTAKLSVIDTEHTSGRDGSSLFCFKKARLLPSPGKNHCRVCFFFLVNIIIAETKDS